MVSVIQQTRFVLLLAFLTAMATSPASAELTAWLDPERIEEGETTQLTVRISDSQNLPEIDLGVLDTDFSVVGSRTNSQLRSVNGRVEASAVQIITLRPKRSGALVVPRLRVGEERTPALSLRVDPLADSVRQAIDDTLFFDVRVIETEPFVQSQITYIRKLYYADGTQLYGDLPATPDVANALVVDLPEVAPYRETRNGRRYGVLEQRFAIFAEQPGTLTVPGQSVTGSVVMQEGGRTRRRGVQVSAPEVSVDVRGVPASYPSDQPWLAARDVRLLDAWDSEVVSVGTPLRRTLTLTAEGATASLLPEISVATGSLDARVYPEPADLTERVDGSTVIGSRVDSRAIVPQRSGRAEVPAVSVVWFDTVSEQVRTATAPARRLFIAPDPLGQPQDDPTAGADPAQDTASDPASADSEPASLFWVWATLFCLLGWLITAALLLRRRRTQPKAVATTARGTNRESLEKARSRLQRAARGGDLSAIDAALNSWLGAYYQCGLADAKRRFSADPAGRDALAALGYARFGRSSQASDARAIAGTIGRQVWQAVTNCEQADSPSEESLPPLQMQA